jgi:hypothetical protein
MGRAWVKLKVEGLVERDLLEGGFECEWFGTHDGKKYIRQGKARGARAMEAFACLLQHGRGEGRFTWSE